MDRVVEIIEANHVFILISFIVVTFYLLWTINSKLKQNSKQVSDLKIKLGSLEKNQSRFKNEKNFNSKILNTSIQTYTATKMQSEKLFNSLWYKPPPLLHLLKLLLTWYSHLSIQNEIRYASRWAQKWCQ